MAKFSGYAGFAVQIDKGNGIWKEEIVEKLVKGDLLNEVWRHQASSKVNEDISVTNRISILADQFVNANKQSLLYVVMDGVPWKVTTVEVQRPRLILNIGGLYNGKHPDVSKDSKN